MPVEWIFIQLFVNSVEIGALYYLLCSKFPAKYKTFIPTLCFVVGSVIFLSLRIFIPTFEALPLTEILTPAICFIYLLTYRQGRGLGKLFWSVASCALVLSVNLLCVAIITATSEIYARDIMAHRASTERLVVMITAKTL